MLSKKIIILLSQIIAAASFLIAAFAFVAAGTVNGGPGKYYSVIGTSSLILIILFQMYGQYLFKREKRKVLSLVMMFSGPVLFVVFWVLLALF